MADIICSVKPPNTLLKPLIIPKKLLMGPGPSNCPTRVLNASAQQLLRALDEDFLKIMDEVKEGIQYAFQTTNKLTFGVSGTGHCAMETAICNTVEPNDIFLVTSPGIWGSRALEIGSRIGAKCHQMEFSAREILDLEKLKEVAERIKPSVVFICHGDSSTGALQPLEEITEYLNTLNCVIIVDCVASLGAAPILMDKWGVDVLYSGSQKILNAPPGLSPISFSSKAVRKIQRRKKPVPSFYMDALLIGNYWGCDDGPRRYHHTVPNSVIYAVREALALLCQETLEVCWKRHLLCAEKLWKTVEDMGLELFIRNKANRLPSVTTIIVPTGVNGYEVVNSMRKRFNIDIAGGLGTTFGIVWRIGLMGFNCSQENVSTVSKALKECLDFNSLTSVL